MKETEKSVQMVQWKTLGPDKDSYSSTRGEVTTSPWQGTQVERYVYLVNITLQMEGIYLPVILIHSCHSTWYRNKEDGLKLYLGFKVKDCAEKKSPPPPKKFLQEETFSLFYVQCVLRGWNFITQRWSNKWCQHTVDMFCCLCTAASLNKRKDCLVCCRKQTMQNIHPVHVQCIKIILCYVLSISYVLYSLEMKQGKKHVDKTCN